jgi:signal transduction histidine kinase
VTAEEWSCRVGAPSREGEGVEGFDARWVVLFSCGALVLVLAVGGWQFLRRRSRHLPAELWLTGLALLGLAGLGMGLFQPLQARGLQWLGPCAALGSVLFQAQALQAIGGRRSQLSLWVVLLLLYLTAHQLLTLWAALQVRAALTTVCLALGHLWIAGCAHALATTWPGVPARVIRALSAATCLLLLGWLGLRIALSMPLVGSPDPLQLIVIASGMTVSAVGCTLAFAELVLDELRRAERLSSDRLQRELGRREGMARLQEELQRARRNEQAQTAWLALLAQDVAQPLADARQELEQLRRDPAAPSLDQPWWLVDEPLRRALATLDARLLPQGLGQQRSRLPTRACDLGRLLQQAVGDLAPTQRGRIQLDLPVRPIEVAAVGYLLRLAIVQLLRNALQHGAPTGPVRVQLRPVFGIDGIKIIVRDRGPGFPAPVLQAFRDADPASWTDPGPQGAAHGPGQGAAQGLAQGAAQGLALVARIAWLSGGRLVLDNPGGEGAQAMLLLSTAGAVPPPAAA